MKILHLSDTHHRVDYRENQDLFRDVFPKMTSPLKKLEEIGSQAGEIDLICHTGDITHLGNTGDYQAVRDCLSGLFPGVPVMVCPGNRDRLAPLEEVFFPESTPEGEEFFRILELDGLTVLSVDNTHPTNPGGQLTEATCGRILSYLRENQERPVILMGHHHYLPEQPSAPCELPGEFAQILSQKNLAGILTGHTHHPYQGTLEGVPYFTGDSLSFVANPVAESKELEVSQAGGYHLLDVTGGKLVLDRYEVVDSGAVLGRVTPAT